MVHLSSGKEAWPFDTIFVTIKATTHVTQAIRATSHAVRNLRPKHGIDYVLNLVKFETPRINLET